MSVANKKFKLSALLMATLITANFVCADAYKNNVVDVKVNKEAGNAVKVTIYTDRPYTEPVVVNKKANNKYVILMPETKSSLKSAPSVSSSDGTVSNVSVNTQDVSGGKGYTKIVITTDKAVTIVPRTQQLGSSTTPTAQKTTTASAAQKAAEQKAAAEKQKQEQAKKAQLAAQQKAKEEAAKKAALEKQRQEQAKKAQLAAQKKAKEEAARKAALEKQKQEQAKLAQSTPKQPLEILENEVSTGKNAAVTDSETDEVLNSQIDKNLKNNKKYAKKLKNKVVDADGDNQTFLSNIKNVKTLINDHNINLWKLLLLAGAVAFPIIVIMLILALDKKIKRRIESSIKKEEDYITDSDMAPQETGTIEPVPPVYGTFNEAMTDTEQSVQNRNITGTPVYAEDTENLEEKSFNNDYEDADFEHDFERGPETVAASEVEVPQGSDTPDVVSPEVIPPVAAAADENKDLPQEVSNEVLNAPAEQYNPDGFLSDFSEVNDKEFFDELVLQSMAEENSKGLPDELPADEIFKFMTEDEPKADIVEEPADTTDIDEIFEEPVPSATDESPVTSDVSVSDEDNLTMLTEVKINDKTGLYLVNYDNFSSLVGHIDDDYFVIKKFNDIVNSNIILKPTEQLDNSTRYLVRVGKNKMVVEVSDTSMSKLIDL